jgi:hypothetical protein
VLDLGQLVEVVLADQVVDPKVVVLGEALQQEKLVATTTVVVVVKRLREHQEQTAVMIFGGELKKLVEQVV